MTNLCERRKIISEYIVFYPKITQGISFNENEFYPFSWAFFIQCYFRIKNRKDHENLDPSKKKDFYCVLVFFLKFFRKYDFEQLKNQNLFKTLNISLCEDKEIKIDKKFENELHSILKKMKGFPDDNDQIKDFFTYIENNFKHEDFIDTRDLLKKELYECKLNFLILVLESFLSDLEIENMK